MNFSINKPAPGDGKSTYSMKLLDCNIDFTTTLRECDAYPFFTWAQIVNKILFVEKDALCEMSEEWEKHD